MTIRLVLADDHRMFREALRVPLAAETDLAVVGEASTGAEALEAVARALPDVLVLDIALPDTNGIEIARKIGRLHPGVGIVALSGHADKIYVDEMLKAGARGYVVKSAGTDDLVAAIRAVAGGLTFLSPEVTRLMVPQTAAQTGPTIVPPPSVLGQREREVLRLVAEGKRTAEIAGRLGITTATAEVHRRNIKRKLGLHTTAELTRYAIREGLCST